MSKAICSLAGLLAVGGVSTTAFAVAGGVVATLPFASADFVVDPTRPIIYASVPAQNSVAVINTQNFSYQMVAIGSSPIGMTLSPDSSRLYVANSGSSFVGVLNTQTLIAGAPLLVPNNSQPTDVAFGNGNRLFVLGGGIQQIDATTGVPIVGASANSISTYGGTLEISPDRNTLYYGQQGLSPTTLYKIDATAPALSVLKSTSTGSNGRDVTLNHSGSVVSQPNGAPYQISLLRTSDFATLGSLNTGAYPDEIAFSPDDKIAYTYADTGTVQAYDLTTYLSVAPAFTGAVGNEMIVDQSGHYLFASSSTTKIYDTGRFVPEPASLMTIATIGIAGMARRRRVSR